MLAFEPCALWKWLPNVWSAAFGTPVLPEVKMMVADAPTECLSAPNGWRSPGTSLRAGRQALRYENVSANCLQEILVFGDQGRTGRPPEEFRDAPWWEAIA